METGPITFGANCGSWLGVLAPEVLALIHEPSYEKRLRELGAQATRQGVQNALGAGVRFIAPEASQSGREYEQRIYFSGEIATRDNLHDFYNAAVWLTFPRCKAALNALHVRDIGRASRGAGRGPARDAATLFDESGMIFLTDSVSHAHALRHMRWSNLFRAPQTVFASCCRPFVFGHALLEKLHTPYKSMTAHAWIVLSPPRILGLPLGAQLAWVDAQTAEYIGSAGFGAATFAPIPVLGIPGWCDANRNPDFYDDDAVFRRSRGRTSLPETAQKMIV